MPVGDGTGDGRTSDNASDNASDEGRVPEGSTPDGNAPKDERTFDGTASKDDRIPVGKMPDGTKFEGSVLGTTIGTGAVGKRDSISATMLDRAVGKATGGTPDASEESKFGKSGRSEDKTGGRTPSREAVGAGAVEPRLGGPTIPESSETTKDNFPGRSK